MLPGLRTGVGKLVHTGEQQQTALTVRGCTERSELWSESASELSNRRFVKQMRSTRDSGGHRQGIPIAGQAKGAVLQGDLLQWQAVQGRAPSASHPAAARLYSIQHRTSQSRPLLAGRL